MAQPVLALELNELCPSLLDRWMADGTLPNFKRLHDSAHVFRTEADVTDPSKLEPWIQWYSIHTGLAYDQHGVFHLTDGARADHRDVWRTVMAAGGRAFSFASMNARAFSGAGSLFVGDPWSENGDAWPAELNIYNCFIGHNVREYSNAANPLRAADYAAFLRFLVTHGLSARTAWATLRQLASEKLRSPHLSYRRVAILDALQYDVFAHYYRSLRPEFASFFLNSVAHLQHSYWRQMDPDAFTVKPTQEEQAKYGGAIRFGYQAMDRLVGRFLRLADRHGATLVLQTALSQQPFTRGEAEGGHHFHRLRDAAGFLASSGIRYRDLNPVMTHQYMVTFDNEADRLAAHARLRAFELEDGREVFDFARQETEEGLYFGARITWAADPETPILDRRSNVPLRLGDILYKIDGMKSGCHHPVGALWIRTGEHVRHEELVSILDILPTQLELLGLGAEAGERRGRSLVPLLDERRVAA